jgi:SAM-dependent methyltransferase
MNQTNFDTYAENYDAELNRGLSISGEDRAFYARGRIEWLAKCLERLQFLPRRVLDFGCGTGLAAPFFLELLGAKSVLGLDLSTKSLAVAQCTHATLPVEFKLTSEYKPDGAVDLAFCNGVFHHVPPKEQLQVAQYILDCLRPGGLLAVWENNPWNPGTRYIMSKVSFDRDAIPLNARELRAVMRQAGLDVLRTDYYFIFPRIVKAFRFLERHLTRLPLGGQYQVLGRKAG